MLRVFTYIYIILLYDVCIELYSYMSIYIGGCIDVFIHIILDLFIYCSRKGKRNIKRNI